MQYVYILSFYCTTEFFLSIRLKKEGDLRIHFDFEKYTNLENSSFYFIIA